MSVDMKTRNSLLRHQKDEISEHIIYQRLARRTKDRHNREILERISADELKHYT